MSENTVFGHLPNGEEVKSVRLVSGEYSVTILTLGAIIHQFNVPCRGSLRNIVFSSPDLAGYIGDSSYKGQCVAPYANRIRNAEFCLDGVRYTLDRNNGPNNLHSGSGNLGQKNWNIIFQTDNSVVLNAEHCAMEGGFPGNIGVTVSYLLTDGRLTISYTMVSDADTAVNPTNHSYFNLAGQKGGPVTDHVLTVRADRYTPCGAGNIPTGEILPVAGTALDLRQPTALGDVFSRPELEATRGLDHNLVLSGGEGPDATLYCPRTGIAMEVTTSMEGMQVYTAGFLTERPGKDGAVYGPHHAVCLETQRFPAAMHHAACPSPLLRAGAEYHETTRYRFFVK